jgi:hypothetical protein
MSIEVVDALSCIAEIARIDNLFRDGVRSQAPIEHAGMARRVGLMV